MRSTRARLLRQDQLLVERDAVHKITKVDHAIPHNTVIAEVTNQVTDEESTCTLRWDEHLTTEEPLEVKIGEIGKITVELVQLADEEGRPVYRYKITDGAAGIDHEGTDLHLGPRLRPDNTFAAKALLSERRGASEAYSAGHFIEAAKCHRLARKAWDALAQGPEERHSRSPRSEDHDHWPACGLAA